MAWLAMAGLWISLLPGIAWAEQAAAYTPVTNLDALVTGQYVLLTENAEAPGSLQNGWLTLVQPQMEGDAITDAAGAVWTLTVTDEGVLLTDPNGVSVSPGESEEKGLTAGEYLWTVTWEEGFFSFHALIGEQPVTLAQCDDLGFRAYGDSLIGELYDGRFMLYRLTEQELPGEPREETSEPTDPPLEQEDKPVGPRLYFGQLHAHTSDSDGAGTVAEAFAGAAAAGMDFFAVTDHSNSLDGADQAVISEDASAVSQIWNLGREAAKAAATDTFLPLYGYEMTWQNGLGHISTFFTPGFQSRNQAEYSQFSTALETYYKALATVPGAVSQFNHPGSFYGDFENFGHWSEETSQVMQLLEVSCEGVGSYEAYTRALDLGWQVAPTNNENNHSGQWGAGGRTVVYADSLTEEAFASALQNRRVYATEDADLEIMYRLEGQLFGSMLQKRQVGQTVTLTAAISDPTDEAIGKVEVIVDGGAVAVSETLETNSGELEWQLSSEYSYYYLRITQPDGDVAVTAPVWIQQKKDAEITSFTTDTVLAVQKRPISVSIQVRNRDSLEMEISEIAFFLGEEKLGTVSDPVAIPGNSSMTYQAALTIDAAGVTEIQAVVKGTIAGEAVECTAALTVTFLTEDAVTTIVADGTYGTLPELTEVEAVAAKHAMVLVRTDDLTAGQLSPCDLLLIPAPEGDYSEEYGKLVAEFLRSGRTVIFTAAGDRENPEAAVRLNALLETLGLTARFRDDTAYDLVNNGGKPTQLFTMKYEKSLGIREPYCQLGGCTVDPGQGQWLVKGLETTFSIDGDGDGLGTGTETCTEVVEGVDVVHDLVVPQGEAVLLVKEDTAFGGSVFLAGGAFLGDDALDPGGDSIWESPNGNGLLLEQLLNISRAPLSLSTIADARAAEIGTTVRVQGFVTAGTAVPGNGFPDMIYIQDETAGLGILGFADPGVSLGTPVEVYLLREETGFRLLHWEQLEGFAYIHQPKALALGELSYDVYGDQLASVEGKVIARTLTDDGKGLSGLTLEDRDGNRVTVRIEAGILSSATGKNTLAETVKEGDWVSAVGIVYRVDGQTVLRVRNCEEVTAIRETDKTYRVVKGEHSVWIRKDGKSVYMEVDGPGKELIGVEVDGERISQSSYQTTEGEYLVFRFWPRYLKTLELGAHSVVFRFRDGEAKATLVVWNYADNPYTGDTIGLYLLGMVLSGGLLLIILWRRKKNGR